MVLRLRLTRARSKITFTHSIRRSDAIKTGFLILASFLLLGTRTSAGAGSDDAVKQRCYAVVEKNKALFAFPIEQEESWRWYRRGTKDNQLEYSWEVVIREQKGTFNVGAYLFKSHGRAEENGSLEQLLDEAQCSVSEEEVTPGGGTTARILQITGITCTAVDHRIVIGVTGEAIKGIFSQKPRSAHFVTRQPSGYSMTCEATIHYLDDNKR